MPKKVTIEIIYNEPAGEDLSFQEIKETVDGLKNSLLSQVGGLSVNISDKITK
jgi:DNA-binding HxlR family transcriptional regulator